MFIEKTRKLLDVPPKMAQELLGYNTFEGQRRFRPWWKDNLVRLHQSGELRRCDVGMACVNGSRVLVNGQHTLQAIVDADDAFPCVYVEYDCKSKEDLWRLYASFDTHLKRSQGDVLRAAHGMFKYPDLRDMPARVLSTCLGALVILRGPDGAPLFATPQGMTPTDKVKLLEDHLEDVIFISEIWDTKRRGILTVPAVAAAMAIFRKGKPEQDVFAFWRKILTGENITASDCEYRLREALFALSAKGGSGGWPRFRQIYIQCVGWWNTSRTKENRQFVKAKAMKTIPEVHA